MNVPCLAQLGPSRLAGASVTVDKGASELRVPTELWSGGARNILSQILPSSIKDENGVLTGKMVKLLDRMTFNQRPETDKLNWLEFHVTRKRGCRMGVEDGFMNHLPEEVESQVSCGSFSSSSSSGRLTLCSSECSSRHTQKSTLLFPDVPPKAQNWLLDLTSVMCPAPTCVVRDCGPAR